MKFRKGDKVIVVAGKNKGAKASIKEVLGSGRVIVEGVGMIKRHQKARKKGEKGTVIERESSIHASNVMHFDAKAGKQTRTGSKMVGEKKVRIGKASGEEI